MSRANSYNHTERERALVNAKRNPPDPDRCLEEAEFELSMATSLYDRVLNVEALGHRTEAIELKKEARKIEHRGNAWQRLADI